MHSSSTRYDSTFSSVGVLLASLLVFASGCTDVPATEDLGVTTTAILGESGDNADESDLGRLRGAGVGLIEGLPGIALKCDAEPTTTTEMICGQELPASERYEWSECKLGMNGQRKGKGGGGPVTAGSIEVLHGVADTLDDCDATTQLNFTDTTNLDVERVMPNGRHMVLSGSVVGTSAHSVTATAFTKHVELTVRRDLSNSDGTALAQVEISGTASVAFSIDADGTRRVIDGNLTAGLADDETQSITLKGVTRLDTDRCGWPVAGTLTRVESDGTTHELVFSSTCGIATLDGESVDLSQQRGNGGNHGKKGNGDCSR